jgi:hypothetical protein
MSENIFYISENCQTILELLEDKKEDLLEIWKQNNYCQMWVYWNIADNEIKLLKELNYNGNFHLICLSRFSLISIETHTMSLKLKEEHEWKVMMNEVKDYFIVKLLKEINLTKESYKVLENLKESIQYFIKE